MVRRSLLVVVALVAALLVPTFAFAQDQPRGQDQNQGRDRGGQDGGGRRGNFDPAQMRERMINNLKEQLGTTDEEFGVLQPKLEKVMAAQQEAMGGRFGGGFGRRGGGPGGDDQPRSAVQQAARDLRQTLENKDAPVEDITRKLTALREARAAARASLEAAQKDLKDVLTPRQEAVLVASGMLE